MDPRWDALYLDLSTNDTAYAQCYPTERLSKRGMKVKRKNLAFIIDLGGLFGEMLLLGKCVPWGARIDITDFLACNRIASAYRQELDRWFYTDNTPLSFRKFLLKGVHKRRFAYITEEEFKERLPATYRIYVLFKSLIDQDEFKAVIEELWADSQLRELTTIAEEPLTKLIRRVSK
jgi:hypothetical protein